jgi:hypothetical protein
MPIPSSPSEVSLGQLRVELVNTETNDFALKRVGRPTTSGFAGATDPPKFTPVNQNSPVIPNDSPEYALSEWWDYDHSAYGFCSITKFTTPTIGKFFTYYKIQVTGDEGTKVRVRVEPIGAPNSVSYVNVYLVYPFEDDGSLIQDPPEIRLTVSGFLNPSEAIFTRGTVDPEYLHIVIFEASSPVYNPVYINVCSDLYTDNIGNLIVRVRSTSNPGYSGGTSVNVLTSVSVTVNLVIDNVFYTEFLSLTQGTNFVVSTLSNLPANKLVANVYISDVNPDTYLSSPAGGQDYLLGQSTVGVC